MKRLIVHVIDWMAGASMEFSDVCYRLSVHLDERWKVGLWKPVDPNKGKWY